MMKTIRLTVSHPEQPAGRIAGFRFLWAFYVNGYRPERHCQPCFLGRRVEEFCTSTAQSGRLILLDRMEQYPYVYVCGVGAGPKAQLRFRNLHFPLRYVEGAVAETISYNGYRFRAEHAELVPIPPLEDGWGGKNEEHVRCKNFQFAVAYFGAAPEDKLSGSLVTGLEPSVVPSKAVVEEW